MPRKKADPKKITNATPEPVDAPKPAVRRGRPPSGHKMTIHTHSGPVELTFESEADRATARKRILARICRSQAVEGIVAKEGTYDFTPTLYIVTK